jgi:hypothetical protein
VNGEQAIDADSFLRCCRKLNSKGKHSGFSSIFSFFHDCTGRVPVGRASKDRAGILAIVCTSGW